MFNFGIKIIVNAYLDMMYTGYIIYTLQAITAQEALF